MGVVRIVQVGLLCGALWSAADAVAGPPRSSEGRVMQRCQMVLGREALFYAKHLNGALAKCLTYLSACANGEEGACRVAPSRCASVPSDVNVIDERLPGVVRTACQKVPFDQLLAAGVAADLPGCQATTLDELTACFLRSLHTEGGRAIRRVQSSACELLGNAGLLSQLPPELCDGQGGSDPCVCP